MSIRDLLSDLGLPDVARNPMHAAQRAMRPHLLKRFYTEVTVSEQHGGWAPRLDGKTPRTPRGHDLLVPTATLAEALAVEWAAQADVVDPATMPLTRLINVTIDLLAVDAEAERTIAEIVKYAGSDLVCYRADAPAALVERQSRAWDPVLAFAREQLGAGFVLAQGVVFVGQPPEALAAVRRSIEALPRFGGVALSTMTALTGSALVALAVAHRALTPATGWDAGHVDEDWQMDFWGCDEAALARRAVRKAEWDAAVLVLTALR